MRPLLLSSWMTSSDFNNETFRVCEEKKRKDTPPKLENERTSAINRNMKQDQQNDKHQTQ